jgi:hypothetical protein
LTKGFETNDQAFWYNSPAYRFAIQKTGDTIYILDVRDYLATPTEEFYTLPNTQGMIRVNPLARIDTLRYPNEKIVLAKSNKPLSLKENGATVSLFTDNKRLATFTPTSVEYFPLSGGSQTMTFSSSHYFPIATVFLIVIISYFGYIIFVYRKKRDHAFVSIVCLLLFFTVLVPVYTSGMFFDDNLRLSSQSLLLLPYGSHLPLSPEIKVALLFQVLPVLLILLVHLVMTRKLKNIPMLVLSLIIAFSILFFFKMFDTYIAFGSTFWISGKKAMLLIMSLPFIGFLVGLLLLYRAKKETLVQGILILIICLVVLSVQKQLFADKPYIVTPFELSALEIVSSKQKPVLYVQPDVLPTTYRDVWPLITQDKKYMEALTATKWEQVAVAAVDTSFQRNSVSIFIPRYLGTDLFSIEDRKSGAKKIFDNGQIGIFETK